MSQLLDVYLWKTGSAWRTLLLQWNHWLLSSPPAALLCNLQMSHTFKVMILREMIQKIQWMVFDHCDPHTIVALPFIANRKKIDKHGLRLILPLPLLATNHILKGIFYQKFSFLYGFTAIIQFLNLTQPLIWHNNSTFQVIWLSDLHVSLSLKESLCSQNCSEWDQMTKVAAFERVTLRTNFCHKSLVLTKAGV